MTSTLTLTIAQAIEVALDHHRAGRLSEAEKIYRRVLEAESGNADALHFLGVIAHQVGKNEIALELIREAIGANPGSANCYSNLGLVLQAQGPLKGVGVTNFYLAYHGMNDRGLQGKVAKYYEQVCPSLLYTAPHCARPRSAESERIRVGFLFRFVYNHSVSLCVGKIVEELSRRGQFEVALISSHDMDDEGYKKTYFAIAGERVYLPLNLAQAREKVAALELDILVYLDIGMDPLSYSWHFPAWRACSAFGADIRSRRG